MSDGDREVLEQLMTAFSGGPTDAQRMDWNLDAIEKEDVESEDKYIAFENLEMIVQNIDNAHNLENDNRWTRLITQLESEDPELRRLAAWCCGTAVQNNIRSQERVSRFFFTR